MPLKVTYHTLAGKKIFSNYTLILVLLIEKGIIRELLYQKIIITIPKNTAAIFRAGVISDFRRNGTIRRFQTYFNLIPHGNSCVGGSAYQTVKKVRAIMRNVIIFCLAHQFIRCNAMWRSTCRAVCVPRPAEMAEIIYFSSSLEAIIDTFRALYIISTYLIVDFSKQISLCFFSSSILQLIFSQQ